MRARDLVVEVPTVSFHDPVADALRTMTQARLPGLVVVDGAARPQTVLPGAQVLRMAVLGYEGDPALVRTIDEAHADRFWRELGDRTVGECLPRPWARPVVASLDATLLELATLMARRHCPLVAIVDAAGVLVGAVTINRLLRTLAVPDQGD